MNIHLRAAALGAILTCGFTLPATADDEAQAASARKSRRRGHGGRRLSAQKLLRGSKRFELMDKTGTQDHRSRDHSSHGAESIVWANHPEAPPKRSAIRCEPRRRADGLGILRRLAEDFHMLDATATAC